MSGMFKRIYALCNILLFVIIFAQPANAADMPNTPPSAIITSESSNTDPSANEPTPCDYAKAFNSYFNPNNIFNSTDQPAWVTRTDMFYDIQQKNTPVFGFETIQPLFDRCRNTLFAQGRAGYTSGATVFNLGLGNRYMSVNKQLMLGINVFYDEIFRYPHRRVGLGGEFYTPYITLRGNIYDALSGRHWVGHNNTFERALTGFDASIETPVPYIAWMRFTLKGYHWKGNTAPSVNGGLVNFRVYPARQLEMAVGYANDNSQHAQLFLNLNYYFGSPEFIQYSATTPHPCQLFTPQDLEKIRTEKVLRTNQIVVEKTRVNAAGVTYEDVIIARTD